MAEQLNSNSTPPSLDDFPSSVLLHILGFLPLRDAVRANLISRKWRNLWHSLPFLKLDILNFPRFGDGPAVHFYDFVNLALLQRSNTIPLHKLRLISDYIDNNHRNRSLVTSWIRYALNCQVVDLHIYFGVASAAAVGFLPYAGSDEGQYFDFHFLDLKNSSVRVFTLSCSRLSLPLNSPTRFESLQSVELDDVFVPDEMLTHMISMCVNLEKLVLSRFRGLRKFRIFSEKLKELEMNNYLPASEEESESSVEICAPNLRSIKLDGFHVEKYTVTDFSVLKAELEFWSEENYSVKCWEGIMAVLAGAEQLIVQNMWLMFLSPANESTPSFELNNLKYLELKTGYTLGDMLGLWSVLQRSTRLETLVLNYVYPTDKDVSFYDKYHENKRFPLNIPNLKELRMKNFRKTVSESLFLYFIIRYMVVLEKLVLIPAKLEGTSRSPPIIVDIGQIKIDVSSDSQGEN